MIELKLTTEELVSILSVGMDPKLKKILVTVLTDYELKLTAAEAGIKHAIAEANERTWMDNGVKVIGPRENNIPWTTFIQRIEGR